MDALEQQKIQVMIDMATQNLRSEVRQLKDQISSMQSELGDVRRKALSTARVVQTPEEPVRQTTFTEREPVATAIDRNGVAPSEVSIEKMFYCGNKRF